MGNGHFVALMGPDQIRKFATAAWKLWLAHREHFYKSVRQEAAYQVALAAGGDQRPSNVPLLDTLCCITVYDRRLDATPQKLFEVLSQIRNKALENKSGGVYVDYTALRMSPHPLHEISLAKRQWKGSPSGGVLQPAKRAAVPEPRVTERREQSERRDRTRGKSPQAPRNPRRG
jgi:hypothetical protein